MPLIRRPELWLPPIALMAVIFFLSAQPSLDSGLGLIDLVGRKLLHFGEYALLCALWWRAFSPSLGSGRAVLLAFLISSGYAATDELHQSFVEGRTGTPVDWAIDSAGAGLAALLLRRGRRHEAVA